MNRYHWKKVADQPQKHQLFDAENQQSIAEVEETATNWKWQRHTSFQVHGAHPGYGTAESLILAKIAVMHDLMDEA